MENIEYRNKAECEFCACGETRTICSNEVCAKKIIIRIETIESKRCVFTGDRLDYTIKICNDSLVDIDDPLFSDDLPEGLKYVKDSFRVNNKPETPILCPYGNKISYKLHKIKANSEVIIKFETIVL